MGKRRKRGEGEGGGGEMWRGGAEGVGRTALREAGSRKRIGARQKGGERRKRGKGGVEGAVARGWTRTQRMGKWATGR